MANLLKHVMGGEQPPEGYQPISTAPRDGTPIHLWAADADFNGAVMRWNPQGTGFVQPGLLGIWEMRNDRGQVDMTWSEDNGFGPSHWKGLQ